MITRILTAIVALLLLVPLLIWGGVWGAGALFALVSGFSVYEMLCCCGLIKKWAISIPAIIVASAVAVLPILSISLSGAVVIFGVPALTVLFLIFAVVMHEKLDVERMLMFITLAVYITAGFTALSMMRALYGLWTVAFVLSVAWATDTFAYFSGMLFGKKKLCPNISPKKTIAGAIGGTLFGTLAGVLVFWLADKNACFGFVAFLLSIVSQFGDLAASVIKRRFGVKDYGKIFPGHGGVLDRFDSIIPVSIITAGLLFAGNYFQLI